MALSLCTGCGISRLGHYYADKDLQVRLDGSPSRNLLIHYFGCGGMAIQHGETLLMTDPFFSNFSLGSIALKTIVGGNIQPKPTNIEYGLSRLPAGIDMEDIKGVFISHAHYDHLLDVPWLFKYRWAAAPPKVYGSGTAAFILSRFDLPPGRMVNVEPFMADPHQDGQWIKITPGVRVLPIKSHHAPHFLGIKLYAGENQSKFRKKPGSFKSKLNHWREGQTLAYLFEFSDGDSVFNLFVQTSASKIPMGLPTADVLKGRQVDLAVLCVASYNNVKGYPDHHLEQLRPKGTIFVHWEDFFRGYRKSKLRTVPGTNVKRFVEQVDKIYDGTFWLPAPGVTFDINY